MGMCDHKEYARQMRTNAVVRNDIVQVSQELWEQIATIIENSVEVVRCKDCKWYKAYVPNPFCDHYANGLYECKMNDFCSYGERRTDV